jgi:enamine deaminase RidA (YjgF/YER057c/UK114 family)
MIKKIAKNFCSKTPITTVLNCSKTSPPVGAYSKAVKVNFGGVNLVFCSGSIGTDHKTNKLPENVSDQTKCALENIKLLLEYF